MEIQHVRTPGDHILRSRKDVIIGGGGGAWCDSPMDQITIKTPNPKCRLFLKKVLDLAAGVYLCEAPSPPRFCLGW
jgi:hypothetical protein